MTERRRNDLRQFLRSRRARVRPGDVGLPDAGRRRTPGLRREEVAVLAGVGTSWYQWLEQGRDITVSPQVLDAVARVLRLDPTERRHLYVLAGLNPPPPESCELPPPNALARVLDAWLPNPALVVDRYWEKIAGNAAAAELFDCDGRWRNSLSCLFLNPLLRERYEEWERVASVAVAQFRADASQFASDQGFCDLAAELSEQSPEFAELWARQEIDPGGTIVKRVHYPGVGRLEFDTIRMRLPERPDLTVLLYSPVPGSGTAERLPALTELLAPAAAVVA